MTKGWWVVLFLGALTIGFKAVGPVLLGGSRRELPLPLAAALSRFPAAIFAALLVTQVFSDGQSIVVDARLGGLLTAVVSVAGRAPRLVTLLAAVIVTALLRRVSL
jgi:branched-subunit amino acid transport protein